MSAWVLLRGLARDSRHWGMFTTDLAVALDADVVALDLPGNGERHAERSPGSVDGMVDAVRAALRARGSAPPYRVLALSLGAMVALAWAERHPDECRCLVLVNTSGAGASLPQRRLRWQSLPLVVAAVVSRQPQRRERAILALTSRHPRLAHDALLREWTRWHVERPVATANGLRQLWAAARFRARASKPDVPILLLASLGDELVDPRCSRQLADRWGVELRVHPSAGHDLPLDAGEWVVGQVVEWLARVHSRGIDA